MPLNLPFGRWWAMNWCFHSFLMMLSPCFKGEIVKTTHSVCKVVGFPHGWCCTYTVPPLPFYNTSVQYFGSSLWSIFVFNNLINLCFSEKSIVTWYGFLLDHFCIWWVGHIPVRIPKGLFGDPFLPQTLLSPFPFAFYMVIWGPLCHGRLLFKES